MKDVHPNTPHKLTIRKINEIKSLLRDGVVQKWIASKYGVSQTTVSRWGRKMNYKREE